MYNIVGRASRLHGISCLLGTALCFIHFSLALQGRDYAAFRIHSHVVRSYNLMYQTFAASVTEIMLGW
jgi:hypothetical protein